MSMKMMNAAYLVDNAALLSLQEKQDGVEFHCFDMDSKVQIAEGHIGWDVLDKQPFPTLEESARVAALKEIPQLDGLKKLRELRKQYPEQFILEHREHGSVTYTIPKRCVGIRPPYSEKRREQQRQEAKENGLPFMEKGEMNDGKN